MPVCPSRPGTKVGLPRCCPALLLGLLRPLFSPTLALPAHGQGVPQTEGSDLGPGMGAGAVGIPRQWGFKAIRLKYLCKLVKV